MSSAPTVIPFYGEGVGRLFPIYCDVTQACGNRPTHDPHVTHDPPPLMSRVQRGSWGSASERKSTTVKIPPRLPVHRSGPGPTTCRAYVWPRPGGSCRCTKVGSLLFTPLLMHGQSEPRPWPHQAGQRREAGAQGNQSNAKTKRHKDQEGEVDSPGKTLAGALARALRGRPPRPQ